LVDESGFFRILSRTGMRTTARLLFCFLLLFLVPNGAIALDRVAFIIGNDAYPDVPLDNAVRDARAVKAMLTGKLGFPEAGILVAEDADRLTIFEKFEEFKGLAKEADIVMVFYAGHGMESLDGKENFLIPVDAQIAKAAQSEAALRATGVNLMDLSTQLAAATTGAKIILMDCCRERPAGRGAIRAGGGLVTYADAEIPADTLMILAAAPNRVASDGEQHGPFTEALLEVLPGNGNNLMDAFFAVSDRVREVTGDQQVPWLKFDGSGQIFRQQKFLAVAGPSAIKPVPMVPAAPAAPAAPMKTLADQLRGATKEAPFVNSLGLEFVPVPGKTGVFLCRTETRVRDFRAYAEATDYVQTGGAYVLKFEQGKPSFQLDAAASWEKPGFEQGEDHPVVCVSWEEARAMAAWLSTEESGLTYRLPADAEWSAAVGSVGKYPWGNAWPPPVGSGNYFGKEGTKNWPGSGWTTAYEHDDGAERTARIASYAENRFGFFDLGGNVFEWCEDPYRASMNDADLLEAYSFLKREKDSEGTPYRVLRGGSWVTYAEFALRSSYRDLGHPTSRYDHYGFRLVVSVGVGG
jgi:formylglycine-generating enzyme required for sulfatase activity